MQKIQDKSETIVFGILFLSYATFHICRQSYDNSKDEIVTYWNLDKTLLGSMDGVFLVTYSIGQFTSGVIGDRFNPVSAHTLGLLVTSLIMFLFGVSVPILKFTNNEPGFFLILWGINGLFQSLGYPTAIKILFNYFQYSNYDGIIFGVWSSCRSFGDLIAALYTIIISKNILGWLYIITSIQGIIVSIIIYIFVKDKKNIENLHQSIIFTSKKSIKNKKKEFEVSSEYENIIESDSDESLPSDQQSLRLSFKTLLCLPIVIQFSFIYSCIKSVHYSLLIWYPYLLNIDRGQTLSETNHLSIIYSVGAILGSIICGILCDKYKKNVNRIYIIFTSTILSILPIFFLRINYKINELNYFMAFMSGLLLAGPEKLIPSLFASMISIKLLKKGQPSSISSIVGIITGFGAFASSIVVGFSIFISEDIFWILLVSLALLASIGYIPLIIHQQVINKHKREDLFTLQILTPQINKI